MAGGQERILRRRIKTVQATKKITRAMELIAASRDRRRRRQRVAAAVPYSERHHRGRARPAAAGGAEVEQPAARAAPETCARSAYVVHRRRPWAVRRLQLHRDPRRRGRDRAHAGARASEYALIIGRPQGRDATSASAATRSRRRSRGFTEQPDLRGRARDRGEPSSGCSRRGELDRVEIVYTRFISRRRARGRASRRCCRSTATSSRAATRCRDGRRTRRPQASTTSSSRRPRRDPRRAAAALRRGAHLRRAAQRGRRRSTRPGSAR